MKKLLLIIFIFCGLLVNGQHHMMHALAGQGLKRGLISVWEFDETTGTTAFDAYASNDGANTDADIDSTGILDKCYYYDGTDDVVTIGDIGALQLGLTVSAWIKFSSSQDNRGIVADWIGDGADNWLLWITTTSNEIGFTCRESNVSKSVTSSSTYDDGNWHFIVGIMDGSNVKLYIDYNGEQLTGDAITTIQRETSSVTIGAYATSGSLNFLGYIDQVGIWSRALTLSEISTLYNSGSGLVYTSW